MAAQVVRCNDCGMRYNGTEYSQCPYCAQSTGAEKKRFGWGRKKPRVEINSEANISTTPPEASTISEAPTISEMPTVSETLENKPAFSPKPVSENPQKQQGTGSRTQSFYAIPVPDSIDNPPEKRAVNTSEPNPEEFPVPGPSAGSHNPSMAGCIQRLGKTTAKYISSENESGISPAVGWLVCVKGVYFGQTFPLKSGMNKIGRSPEMDVALLRDDSVSRSVAMKLAYDSRANEFNALPGESGEICYVSGNAMYERVKLSGYEEIEFGDTGLNKYVFVPLCGAQFRWENYTANK